MTPQGTRFVCQELSVGIDYHENRVRHPSLHVICIFMMYLRVMSACAIIVYFEMIIEWVTCYWC